MQVDALAEVHSPIVHQVDQPSWSADNNPKLLISLERLLLLNLGHASIKTNAMYPDLGTSLHQRIMDLDCEFTGRGDDEDVDVVVVVF